MAKHDDYLRFITMLVGDVQDRATSLAAEFMYSEDALNRGMLIGYSQVIEMIHNRLEDWNITFEEIHMKAIDPIRDVFPRSK